MLAWIVERLEGIADADDTPIGRLPKPGSIDISGLDVTDETMAELFRIDAENWKAEAELTGDYFAQFGDKVPAELHAQLDALKARLG